MEPIQIREAWEPLRERRRRDRRREQNRESVASRPVPPIRPVEGALPPGRPCGAFRIDPEA